MHVQVEALQSVLLWLEHGIGSKRLIQEVLQFLLRPSRFLSAFCKLLTCLHIYNFSSHS